MEEAAGGSGHWPYRLHLRSRRLWKTELARRYLTKISQIFSYVSCGPGWEEKWEQGSLGRGPVAVVDAFTIPLAEMITGDCQAGEMLDQALAAGNFLFQDGDVYRLRPILRQTLERRAKRLYGGRIREYQYNAGLYL